MTAPFEKLVLATHNAGKLAELKEMFTGSGIELLSAASFGLDAPEETGMTLQENALIKARFVCAQTGLPALADDTGLCVAALNGAPGVYSADWAEAAGGGARDFPKAMARVHAEMEENPDRSAYFATMLALVFPDGTEKLYEGRCEGQIIWPPRGQGGFGYDPIFQPEGENRTFAEMTSREKSGYSHRSKALALFRADRGL